MAYFFVSIFVHVNLPTTVMKNAAADGCFSKNFELDHAKKGVFNVFRESAGRG